MSEEEFLAVVTAGQPAVSIAGRIVSLSSAVAKEGRSWYVPLDFFTRALAPAAGLKIEWRAASRAFILGDVKWPQVSVRLERQGAGVRVSGDVQPATAFRLSREGNKVIARLDATALDFSLAGAAAGELVASVRADGAAIVIDLGRSAAIVRPADDGSTHFTVDVAPTPRPGQAEPPPDVRENGIKVVAIDAGHGGEDAGAKSADGAAEKDITLAVSKRLAHTLEDRGMDVVMTRTTDTLIALSDRGLLERSPNASDRRSHHLGLSPAGRALYEQVAPKAQLTQMLRRNPTRVGPPERPRLNRRHSLPCKMPRRAWRPKTSSFFSIFP